MPSPVLTGPIHVVGVGMLGTSVALACRRAGLEVWLSDTDPKHVRTASALGAGAPWSGQSSQVVVVAVPPDHLGEAIAEALERPEVVVTDVGSVKAGPLRAVLASGADASRYVGSHPMAGSERSGPLAAAASLFEGRPWAITPHAGSTHDAIDLVTELVRACGAVPVALAPDEHDRAVARTSHLPHLFAALVAGRLADADPGHLVLSGQGVRDVTRIAAGDPGLWRQILGANAPAVLEVLGEVRGRLDDLIAALSDGDQDGLTALLEQGVAGTAVIPGKHGGPVRATRAVVVAVPDHPGELARLFADAGASGVNIEDVHIDHDPGRDVGQTELVVAEERADHLRDALVARGWTVHG